jgi:hypothetical protein
VLLISLTSLHNPILLKIQKMLPDRHVFQANVSLAMTLLVGTDIHTLAKQLGTSILMLEKRYSK